MQDTDATSDTTCPACRKGNRLMVILTALQLLAAIVGIVQQAWKPREKSASPLEAEATKTRPGTLLTAPDGQPHPKHYARLTLEEIELLERLKAERGCPAPAPMGAPPGPTFRPPGAPNPFYGLTPEQLDRLVREQEEARSKPPGGPEGPPPPPRGSPGPAAPPAGSLPNIPVHRPTMPDTPVPVFTMPNR